MTTEIPDLGKAIEDMKQERIVRVPCNTIRASSLGYFVPEMGGCMKRGVYEQREWKEKKMHDVFVQYIFDEGNQQEKQTIKDLIDAGFSLVENQAPFEFKEEGVTGTIDGKLPLREEAGRVVESVSCEIKSMSPYIYDAINEYEDFIKYPWTNVYRMQINLYMKSTGDDRAIFVLKNKSNGQVKMIEVEYDEQLTEWGLRAAKIITMHVKNETYPEGTDDKQVCKKCPFNHICQPGVDFSEEIKVEDNPEFEAKLDRYWELKPFEKECKDLYNKEIKGSLKASATDGTLKMQLGKYMLTGSTDTRGVFKSKIERIA